MPTGFSTYRYCSVHICSCDPLLSKFLMFNLQVMCSISNQTVAVPQKAIWFGYFNQEQQNQSSLTCDSLVVVRTCEHYCRYVEGNSTTVEVSLTDLDKQCSDGHTGIMCGACKLRYSRVLGELMKCQKDCTNINLPFILVAFLASGFLLLIIIRVLNLTVTEGTINGLLVYTMVIQTHYNYFSENLSVFGQVCWVFISWINLTLGIRACFYRGMEVSQGFSWCFKHLQRVAFAENALFKSYGVIYLPWLPSTLPDELSTDIRNSSRFLSRQRVSTFNNSFCKITDSSLFSPKEMLAYFCIRG